MSFVSRLVLSFAIATMLLSAQGSLVPAWAAPGSHVSPNAHQHQADAPSADHTDDPAEDAIELVDPSSLVLSSPRARESLARWYNLLLLTRTVAPLDQPPRSS